MCVFGVSYDRLTTTNGITYTYVLCILARVLKRLGPEFDQIKAEVKKTLSIVVLFINLIEKRVINSFCCFGKIQVRLKFLIFNFIIDKASK